MKTVVHFYYSGLNRRHDRGLDRRAAVVHLDACDYVPEAVFSVDVLSTTDGRWRNYPTEDMAESEAYAHAAKRGLGREYVTLDTKCCIGSS